MKQEDKDLLLKDICSRLPYGVKCKYYDCCEGDYDEGTICGFERKEYIQIDGVCIHIEEVKPYLFPLDSMTEEQKNELYEMCEELNIGFNSGTFTDMSGYGDIGIHKIQPIINYLLKNNFDINGLIPMGLANDASVLKFY